MQFKHIIGHQSLIQGFVKSVNENRISHAQLFVGPEGTGKLALALAYAQFISCVNKQPHDSCGTCSSCIKYNKLAHPDLHFVFPVSKGKSSSSPVSDNYIVKFREKFLEDSFFTLNDWYAHLGVENSQGMIYANESGEIIRKLSLKTYESEYKIMIIWLPEKMHASAANKLLKLLEEPPAKTLFFLVSEDPDKIIRTILSRTQILKVPAIDNESLTKAISEKYELESTELENLIRLAAGSYKKAEVLINNSDENKYNFEAFVNLMRFCYARQVLEMMDWSEKLAAIGRERQKSFLNYALRMIRENFILNLRQPNMVFLNGEEMNFAQRFSPFINETNVWIIAEELSKAYSDIERNGSAKIIFQDLSLKLIKLLRP